MFWKQPYNKRFLLNRGFINSSRYGLNKKVSVAKKY